MKKCIIYSLFFGIFAMLILFILAPYCSSVLLHGKVSNKPIYIMAISLPFISLVTSLEGYFTGVRRVSKTSLSKILSMFIQVSLTCLFLFIFPSSNLDTVCTYLLLAGTLSSLFQFIFTYLLYRIDGNRLTRCTSENKGYFKKIIRIAFPVAITSYIRSGLSSLKQMLIPFSLEKYSLSCDEALSQYGLINGMTMPLLMFPCIIITSCASLLIPEFARYNIKKDFKKMNQVIKFCFKITSFFSICMIIIFLVFGDKLCYLIYGNTEMTSFLHMLSPLIIFIYLDKIIDAMLRGLDKQVRCNVLQYI